MIEHQRHILVLGRGVYALPLLRILGTKSASGVRIHVTLGTSVGRQDVGSFSRYVDGMIQTPRADVDLEGFATSVLNFVRSKLNVVIIPVGEEVIFVSQLADRIRQAAYSANPPQILVSPLAVLLELHDKFRFQKCMANIFSDQKIPRTALIQTHEEAMEAIATCFENETIPSVVVKPTFGHGGVGSQVIRREDFVSGANRPRLDFVVEQSYVVQEFVEGREFSTFSLCQDGVVVSHVCYFPRFVDTQNGFSPIRSLAPPSKWQRSLDWVQCVTARLRLTGHFGFDFIERFNGDFIALECNPRVTNGLAFFSPRFSMDVALKIQHTLLGLSTPNDVISPSHCPHIMTLVPALACVVRSKSMELTEVAFESYDDMWWWKDPLPSVSTNMRLLFHFLRAILVVLLGWRPSVTDVVKQSIIDEIISVKQPAEYTVPSENVGGLTDGPHVEGLRIGGLRVLVTGATGFLGGRLVKLLHRGRFEDENVALPFAMDSIELITATGRNEEKGKELIASLKSTRKTRFIQADLSDALQTHLLVQGHDVVFHCAALCAPWGRWEDFITANVIATQNVVHSCHTSGNIRMLVYISSPSICFSIDTDDRFNVKEHEPLPPDKKQSSRYSATKKVAESIVLDVASRFHVPCIILRPRAIIGPGDTTLFPLLVDRLKHGKLRIIGNEDCVGDFTHVDNVLYACLCCLNKAPRSPKIYSITNGEPQRTWNVIRMICNKMKLDYPTRRIPRWIAYHGARFCEWHAALRLLLGFNGNPLLTRYAVNVLSRSCTLDISGAKEELGYRTIVSFGRGFSQFLNSQSPP